MKLFYRILPLIALICCLSKSENTFACHAAGGELTYTWLHDSTYKVFFRFYKDCVCGTAEPNPSAQLCYRSPCSGFSTSIPMPKSPNTPTYTNGAEVGTGCPFYQSLCNGGSNPGFREWQYEVEITLPSRCEEWILSTGVNARNTAANLVGGGNTTAYFEATLNNKDVQNNSSPYFSVKPIPFACAYNSPYTYNNGAVDPNNDSLVFELIRPRNGDCGTTPVPVQYKNPSVSPTYPMPPMGVEYTPTNPLDNSAFAFNSSTGQMDFTGTTPGTYTVAVRVNDYRDGIKVGSVLRDIQLQILSCTSPQPTVQVEPSTLNGVSFVNGRILACANNPFTFTFTGATSATTGLIKMTDNHSAVAPGSTVTYTGLETPTASGTFSWTPTTADTGLKIFTVTIKDSNCVPPGILIAQTYVIPIFVRPASITQRFLKSCPYQAVPLTAAGNSPTWDVITGGSDLSSLNCTTCTNVIARPALPTKYFAISKQDNGCQNTDTFTIAVDLTNSVTIAQNDPFIVCRPGTVQLNAVANGPRPLTNLSCGPALGIPSTPEDSVEVIPANIKLKEAQNALSSPLLGLQKTARHQYILRKEDMRYSGQYSGTIKTIAFKWLAGTGAAMNDVRIAMACTTDTQLTVAKGFVTGTVPVLNLPGATAIPAGGGYVKFNLAVPYNWDTSKNLIIDICYANPTIGVTASTVTIPTAAYPSSLLAFTNNAGSICNVSNTPNLSQVNERPLIKFYYNYAPETDFEYTWSGGVFLPHANQADVTSYISEPHQSWVSITNRNGCVLSDTISFYVPNHQIVPRDTNICLGHSVKLQVLNGRHYQWFEDAYQPATTLSCTDCQDPTGYPTRSTIYRVVISDDYGCADTLSTNIIVTPFPQLTLPTHDTTIIFGESIMLQAFGADHYYWTPVSGMRNPGVRTPVVTPSETTIYTVMATPNGNSSCRAYDSVKVNLSTKWPVFVPSAFTPNGDGRNDVFRISNMTFQRVQEFRVFNRWGQQVFGAADNRGWDGTWQGKDQELGSYTYMIRMALPDGETKVFKGEVTLMR